MTTKTKETSRILDAVHETARDLHAAGFVSEQRLQDWHDPIVAEVRQAR